jgi:hypothetical protein
MDYTQKYRGSHTNCSVSPAYGAVQEYRTGMQECKECRTGMQDEECRTSMIGNSQGEAEIPHDLAESRTSMIGKECRGMQDRNAGHP